MLKGCKVNWYPTCHNFVTGERRISPRPVHRQGMYGKELFSVHVRSEGDSGSFSDPRDRGLRGYTEKNCFPYTCDLRVIQADFRTWGIPPRPGIRKRYNFRTSHCLYRKQVVSVHQSPCTHQVQPESLLAIPFRTLRSPVRRYSMESLTSNPRVREQPRFVSVQARFGDEPVRPSTKLSRSRAEASGRLPAFQADALDQPR